MKTHFDKEIDKIQETLFKKIKDMKDNPNLFEDNKKEYILSALAAKNMLYYAALEEICKLRLK